MSFIRDLRRHHGTAGGPPAGVAPNFNGNVPTLVGTPQLGVACSYTPAFGLTGNPTPTITQQWTLDGVNITGATGATYTPISGDVGHLLRVREIATNASGTANATSASGTVIAAPPSPPVFSSAPALLTTPMVGVAISYTPGTVSGFPAPTITQQWTIDGLDIPPGSGGLGATYTPLSGDVGRALRVREIATNASGTANSTSAPGTVLASGALESDWLARSTPTEVFFRERFNTAAAVSGNVLRDGNPGNDGRTVIWDRRIKRSGAGAARINIPDGYGGNPGAVILPWGLTKGNGQKYYVQFSVFIPQTLLRYKPHFSAGQGGATSAGEGGNKFAIISAYPPGSSASNNAVVINNHDYRGFPVTYWYDGISGVQQGQELRSVLSANDNYVWENAINTGSPASPTTQVQYENRYGPLWHNDSLPQRGLPPQDADIYALGFPDAAGRVACPFWLENGWNTVTVEITFGTLGTATNRIRVWACQPGGANLLLQDWQNILMGTDNAGHTGIWLTPYDTNRDYYGKRADTFVVYAEVIASTAFINPPAVAAGAVWTPPYTLPAPGAVRAIGVNNVVSITPSGMSTGAWAYSTGASYSGGTMLNEYSVGGGFAVTSTGGHMAPENPGSAIFDFTDATWKLLPVPGIAYSDATYALGSTSGLPNLEIDANQTPAPAHTIGMTVEIPGRGSAIVPGCAITDSSVAGSVVHVQDLTSGVWTRMSNSQRLASNVDYGYSVFDAARYRIWLGAADDDNRTNFQYYDLADNTWKNTANYTSNFVQLDCRGGPIHMFHGWVVRQGSNGRIFAFHPDEPQTGWLEATVTGASQMPDFGDSRCLTKFAYHPPSGNFYTDPDRTGGTQLHKLVPPKARSVFTGSISGTTLTVATLQSGTVTIGQDIYAGGNYYGRVVSGAGPYTLSQSHSLALTDVVGQPSPVSGTWAASKITMGSSVPIQYGTIHDAVNAPRGYTSTQFVPSIGMLAYFPMNTELVYLINPEGPGGQTYTTNFPLTENPISEGGIWENAGPGALGLAWNNIQTGSGHGYAAAFDTAPGGDRDAVCALKRTFIGATRKQFSAGTVWRAASYDPNPATHEVGVMINVTIAPNSLTGYECYSSSAGSHQMVRWNGPPGSYTVLASNNISAVTAPVDGDVFRFENDGNGVLSFYQNGILRTRATDTTHTGGNPGWNNNPSSGGNAVLASFGFKSWTGGSL